MQVDDAVRERRDAGSFSTAGGAAGDSATPAASAAAPACSQPGQLRCSALGAGKRELCTDGEWKPGQACAAEQACVVSAPGQTMCMSTLDLCRGSEGQAVCDPGGTLYVCNADATVSQQQACDSVSLCQASLAAQHCMICHPGVDHACDGRTLQRCADDGNSFAPLMDCESEDLCNAALGMCTSAVCRPSEFLCDGNTLKKCNAQGTGFESETPCGDGTCDADGGECDICEPGMLSCNGDSVLACNATGQGKDPRPCPGAMKCVGAGQCVACTDDPECDAMTRGCKVGVCTGYSCAATNAPNGQVCDLASGRGECRSGSCTCIPQCDKPCGDSGCPNQPCPNKCGGRMCYHDTCVDCITSADCKHLDDDCNTGVCSAGRCVATPQNRACTDSRGAPSWCSGGRCPACVKQCSGGCGGESDGCGGTCPKLCAAGQVCVGGRCAECTPGQTGCSGNQSDGTPGMCTFEQAGCYYGWTVPNVVKSLRCDSSGHWTSTTCQNTCALPDGTPAYECANVGSASQCLNGGKCILP